MTSIKSEQQNEVVAAVMADAKLAGVLAVMLKAVGNDPTLLAKVSEGGLSKALATLPIDPNCTTLSADQVDVLYTRLVQTTDLTEARAIADQLGKIEKDDLHVPQNIKDDLRLHDPFLIHLGFRHICSKIVERLAARTENENKGIPCD